MLFFFTLMRCRPPHLQARHWKEKIFRYIEIWRQWGFSSWRPWMILIVMMMTMMIFWLIVRYICLAKKYIKAPSGGGSGTLAPSLLSRSIPDKRQKYNILYWVLIMMIKLVLLLLMMMKIFITWCHPGHCFALPLAQTHCSKKSVKCNISYSIIVFPKVISTYFQSTVW